MKSINKGNKGNPYHDEEGKFASASGTKTNEGAADNATSSSTQPSWLKAKNGSDSQTPSWLKAKSGDGNAPAKNTMWEKVKKERLEKLNAITEEKSREKVEFEKFNLGGIDSDYAEEMKVIFDSLIEEYPIKHLCVETCRASTKLGYFMYGVNINRDYFGRASAKVVPPTIRINKIHSNNKNTSNSIHLITYMQRGSKLRTVRNCGVSTCYHEYAHAIIYDLANTALSNNENVIALNNAMGNGEIYNIDDILAVQQGAGDITQERKSIEDRIYSRLKKEYNFMEYEMKNKVLSELGSYAAESHGEFFAEAFANMKMLKDEEKTDFLHSFERIFIEEYKNIKEGK